MHWKQMVNFIELGHSFAPLHHLNQTSFEDLLFFKLDPAVAMAAWPDSCRTEKSKSDRDTSKLKVHWDDQVTDDLVSKHNSKPSKGNFYRASFKSQTRKKYEPFHPEELRLVTARAVGEANDLHKEVQRLMTVDKDLNGDREVSQAASSAKATKAVGTLNGNTVKDKHLQRYFIIDSGASIHFVAKGNLTNDEWAKRKKLRNPQCFTNSKW